MKLSKILQIFTSGAVFLNLTIGSNPFYSPSLHLLGISSHYDRKDKRPLPFPQDHRTPFIYLLYIHFLFFSEFSDLTIIIFSSVNNNVSFSTRILLHICSFRFLSTKGTKFPKIHFYSIDLGFIVFDGRTNP